MTDIFLPNPMTSKVAADNIPLQRWLYSCWLRITNGIKWSVHNNGVNVSIPTTTPTQLPFSTIVTDSVGCYSPSTGIATIKAQGTYKVTACAQLNLTINNTGTVNSGNPSPPFAVTYTTNNLQANNTVIPVATNFGFVPGMAIGVTQSTTTTLASLVVLWYTLVSSTGTSLTVTPAVDASTQYMNSGVPIYGVAASTPSITPGANISYSLSIYQNGVAVKTVSTGGVSLGLDTLEATKNIECNVGDKIAVYVTQTSGNTQSIIGNSSVTYFQGSRIN